MLNLAKKFNETSLNEFELKFKVELWNLKLMKGWQKKTINSIKIIKNHMCLATQLTLKFQELQDIGRASTVSAQDQCNRVTLRRRLYLYHKRSLLRTTHKLCKCYQVNQLCQVTVCFHLDAVNTPLYLSEISSMFVPSYFVEQKLMSRLIFDFSKT